jgi:hypothetical protein
MDIEILHNLRGDKRKKVDTKTKEGRDSAAALIKKLTEQGSALFLERGKNVYRIKGYDAKKDKLIVETDREGKFQRITTRASEAKITAVAPVAGGAR